MSWAPDDFTIKSYLLSFPFDPDRVDPLLKTFNQTFGIYAPYDAANWVTSGNAIGKLTVLPKPFKLSNTKDMYGFRKRLAKAVF